KQVSRISYDSNGDPLDTVTELAGSVELYRLNGGSSSPAASGGLTDTAIVHLSRTHHDNFGNPNVSVGANLRCATVDYDGEYATFPIRETMYTRGCTAELDGDDQLLFSGFGTALRTEVQAYDRGLGLITHVLNVQSQPARFVYDGFGRLTKQFAPLPNAAATSEQPTIEIDYYLPTEQRPTHSLIHTRAQDGPDPGSSEMLESWSIIDGFGRTIATLSEDSIVDVEGDQSTE